MHDSGQRILVGPIRGRLRELAFDDLTTLCEFGGENDHMDVDYVPAAAGHVAALTGDQVLTLWRRMPDGTFADRELERGRLLQRLVFHPTEPRMFVASAKGRVSIWDTAEWRRLMTVQAHGSMILGLAFDATRDRLLTASMDRTVKVFGAASR